jgi:3-oxoacyl-[acyl-carrier protein] reductase
MKTVLVTGSSKGIGREIVKHFSNRGYSVAINYNKSKVDAESLFDEIVSNKGIAIIYKADVSNEEEAKSMVDEIIKEYGHIDVLVNNAGISSKGLLIEEDNNTTKQLIETNLISAINMCKYVIPHMLDYGKGSIVNISSIWGNVGASLETTYSASKSGLIGLTKALAKEYGYNHINVNCVCPGVIDTEMNNNLSPKEKQDIISQIPAGRLGTADDVARLVRFLTSDENDYINGQVITIDGGYTL